MDEANNNLYISSYNNHAVFVVDVVQNNITAVYGTWKANLNDGSYSGDGGAASNATMYSPSGVALDTVNNLLYIADNLNRVIRVVDLATNIINTFAGDYNYGDTRSALNARLTNPQLMAVDTVNNLLYISDSPSNIVRVVDRTTGIISTFAGTSALSTPSFSANGDGGPATSAKLNYPRGIAVDIANNLVYFADYYMHAIRVVDRTTGIISTFAGTGSSSGAKIGDGGNATSAILNYPVSVAVDSVNSLVYIIEEMGHRVRVVNRTTNIISTFAGLTNGTFGFSGDGGPASSAKLYQPSDVKVDTVNNMVYIADSYNTRIRVVNTTNNIIKTLISGIGFTGSSSIASIDMDLDNNLLYYTDAAHYVVKTVCLYKSTVTNAFAGISGSAGYSGNYGNATSATFDRPVGVTVDTANNLVYIVDSNNMVVRVVSRTKIPSCPSLYPTPTPTPTPTPSRHTPTPSPTPTNTGTPTTNRPTPTSTSTATPTPESTPKPTPTTTIIPTPITQTVTPIPTPTTQIQCFNISASDAQICSGNGVCISTDNCQCNSPNTIGSRCEINMQASSTSYIVFDSSSRQSSINIDAANNLPDSSGPISYSFTSDNQMQLTSSSSDVGRKGICLNPSLLVAGLQTFVAFSFPTALPSGIAAEIWLQDISGDYQVSSALRFVDGTQAFELTADSTVSTTVSLSANVTYVLLLFVSEFGSDLSTQVITIVSFHFRLIIF
jgi:DNA-binding beta-propeller fold protein YncE